MISTTQKWKLLPYPSCMPTFSPRTGAPLVPDLPESIHAQHWPCTQPRQRTQPTPTTNANVPKANITTPPSSASPAAAASSSSPCSKTNPPTTPTTPNTIWKTDRNTPRYCHKRVSGICQSERSRHPGHGLAADERVPSFLALRETLQIDRHVPVRNLVGVEVWSLDRIKELVHSR